MRKYLVILLLVNGVVACNSNNANKGSRDIPTKEDNSSTTAFVGGLLTYRLKTDSIEIELNFKKIDSVTASFLIKTKANGTSESASGNASLIRMQNEDGSFYIPEGTAILDESTNKDYFCDSTYSFDSAKLSLGIGFEMKKKQRVSLVVGNSSGYSVLKERNYTLYKVN
jgi:hypothetical protein